MKQKALMILDLLCMVAQGVWADDEPAPHQFDRRRNHPRPQLHQRQPVHPLDTEGVMH